MADRRTLIAGNWKMNGLRADGLALARELAARAPGANPACELLVCPPATLVTAVSDMLSGSGIAIGGQDCHHAEKGAYTGSISPEMLKDAGCSYAIVGHSERRHGNGETDVEINAKAAAAWRADLISIICVGETREQREAGRAVSVVTAQLAGSIPVGANADRLVIAYEPVWAIGTGLTPTLADIIEIHHAVRAAVPHGTRVLYGGSVNPRNAAEILALDHVDGALVGGASLQAEDFWAIAEACR